MVTHPYAAYEGSALWRVLDAQITALEENGDLRLTTARQYVIGSLCHALAQSGVATQEPGAAAG